MKKYLISGIPPSSSGVGRLMNELIKEANKNGVTVITPPKSELLSILLKRKDFVGIAKALFNRKFGKTLFFLKTYFIKSSKIIFIHPQNAGFGLFLSLIKKNEISFYIVDNSFFCIRSYNINPITELECLRCLSSPFNILKECTPEPIRIKKSKNIKYLLKLRNYANRIKFLVQNENQELLIKKCFGDNTHVRIVGMNTGEIPYNQYKEEIIQIGVNKHTEIQQYDFVFHGKPLLAKGIRFFINLANLLPEYTFFIPSTKELCEQAINSKISSSNITYRDCTWESGLKEIVRLSRFVMNPSLWSAPIEGALIKSLFYNGNVFTVQTQYAFEAELANYDIVIRLSHESEKAAIQLKEAINKNLMPNSTATQAWFLKFQQMNQSSNIFNSIV